MDLRELQWAAELREMYWCLRNGNGQVPDDLSELVSDENPDSSS